MDWARALLAQRASLAALRRDNQSMREQITQSREHPTTSLLSGVAYTESELKRSIASKSVEIEALQVRIVDTSRHWANAVSAARVHEEKLIAAVDEHRATRDTWTIERQRMKDYIKSRDRAIARLRHDVALLASVGSESKEKAAKLLVAELARTDSRIRKLLSARGEEDRHNLEKKKTKRMKQKTKARRSKIRRSQEQGVDDDEEKEVEEEKQNNKMGRPETLDKKETLRNSLKKRMQLTLRDRKGRRRGRGDEDGDDEEEEDTDIERRVAKILQHQLDAVSMSCTRSAGQIADQQSLIAALQRKVANAKERGGVAVWA